MSCSRVAALEDDAGAWDPRATVALGVGLALGYVTQFVMPFGLPPVQVVVVTAAVYWLATRWSRPSP